MKDPTQSLDQDLQNLENELYAMLPAEPSDGLRERVRHALLATGEEPVAPLLQPAAKTWYGWVPLAAAAAVALMAVVLFPAKQNAPVVATGAPATVGAQPADDAPRYTALSSKSHLEQVNYEGIRQENTAAYRQIRSHFLESRVYQDSTDGTTVEWHVPREEVWLVPVRTE